jgi:hypothetical protein
MSLHTFPEMSQSHLRPEDYTVGWICALPVELDFAETRVHIAAEIAHVEIGAEVANLGLAAEAAGADAGSVAEIRERGAVARDEAIAHVVAATDRRERKAALHFGGDVFHAVYGNVYGFFQQGVLKFLDEDAFPADLRQCRLLEFVAGRLMIKISPSTPTS